MESKEIIHLEKRRASLEKLAEILDKQREKVLNLRIGATDFSALFGIRRNYDITIYDVGVVAACISDIVNYFLRSERDFIISGPVFEYFSSGEKILKPLLRETPFRRSADKAGQIFRSRLIARHVDTLVREVLMDRVNGLWGKTVIHPSHIIPVESLYVVSHEDYLDARDIVAEQEGNIGVAASNYKNRMNEFKPHYNWASKVLRQAKIFGVFREEKSFSDLLLHED